MSQHQKGRQCSSSSLIWVFCHAKGALLQLGLSTWRRQLNQSQLRCLCTTVDHVVKHMLKVKPHTVPAAGVTKLVLHSPFLFPSSAPVLLTLPVPSLPWGQVAEPIEFWAAARARMSSGSSSTLRGAGGGHSKKGTKAFHYPQRSIRQWWQGVRSNLLEQDKKKEHTSRKRNKHSLVSKCLLLLPLWAAKYLRITCPIVAHGALGMN